jgi:hypothetical protein
VMKQLAFDHCDDNMPVHEKDWYCRKLGARAS